MSTDKDAQFKKRQREFRALNAKSYGYSVKKGNLDKTGAPILMPIVNKDVLSE